MRIRFILCFFILSCAYNLQAQQNADDSLRAKIDTLEKQLSENNYTRIPNKDFDTLLEQKVDEKVSDEIQSIIKWVAIIEGLVVLILGFLAKYYFNDIIRKELKESSDKLKEDFTSSSKKLETEIKNTIDKRLIDTVSVIWEESASNLLRKAKDLNYQDDTIINSLSHYLETENLKLSNDLKLDLIAALVRCYFFYKKKDKLERLIQIINKYEAEKIKLRPETYADAAIVFCDNYEFSGLPDYLKHAIDYSDKSISVLTDYGTPYAVKLEAFMINYKKAYNDEEKLTALENIKRTFKSISNNKSDTVCVDTLARLLEDENPYQGIPSYLKEYLEELEKQFPQELKDMKQRAFNYLTKNPQDLGNPNTNDLFESLKAEGFVATA